MFIRNVQRQGGDGWEGELYNFENDPRDCRNERQTDDAIPRLLYVFDTPRVTTNRVPGTWVVSHVPSPGGYVRL